MRWIDKTGSMAEIIAFTEKWGFDFSQLKSVTLSFGFTGGGLCRYKTKKRKYYTIHARLVGHFRTYPHKINQYVRPTITDGFFTPNYDQEIAATPQEAMAWLLGHELWHFLRKTKQVPGRNTQAQANVFGFKFMREFKQEKEGGGL